MNLSLPIMQISPLPHLLKIHTTIPTRVSTFQTQASIIQIQVSIIRGLVTKVITTKDSTIRVTTTRATETTKASIRTNQYIKNKLVQSSPSPLSICSSRQCSLPPLQEGHYQHQQKSCRRSDMDMVLCLIPFYRTLLLHSFLCRQLQRYLTCVRNLPNNKILHSS